MSRYSGFLGGIRGNLLIEQAIEFGVQCHGINLKITINNEARRIIRAHLDQPEIPKCKEEVFYALSVAVLTNLNTEKRKQLTRDIQFDHEHCGVVSDMVLAYFMAELERIGPDEPETDPVSY